MKSIFRKITLFLVAVCLFGLSGWALSQPKPKHPEIIKSPNDDKIYETLTLDNKLPVMIVSDKAAHVAGAIMVVKRGSFHEPKDMPGLAHFCEHMLFLGTKNYPEPESFSKFVKSHGGNYNAFTRSEDTKYFYTLKPDALPESLERLADFFKAPLFDKQWVEREINAVDSEFQMYLNNDSWGILDVSKETANPIHPFSRFSVGNLESLSKDKNELYHGVKAFYQKHYKPENMALIVGGPQSVQELKALVEAHFGSIPAAEKPENVTFTMPMYTQSQMGCDVYVQTKGEVEELSIQFHLKKSDNQAIKKAGHIISNILEDESEGTLAAYLKSKNFISSINVMTTPITANEHGFFISYSLTPKGVKNINQITKLTYGFINHMKSNGIPAYLVDDMRKISKQHFMTDEKVPLDAVIFDISENFGKVPDESLLTTHYLLDADIITKSSLDSVLEQLTPKNMRRYILSNQLETNKVSKWFKYPYKVVSLNNQLKDSWLSAKKHKSIGFPKKNEFIANNFELKPIVGLSYKVPTKIVHEKVTLWHHQDSQFKVPKGEIKILFQSDRLLTPETAVMAKLYAMGVVEENSAALHPAKKTGAAFTIGLNTNGLELSLSGFNDGQTRLLNELITRTKQFQFTKSAFKTLKDQVMQEYRNYSEAPLYMQAFSELQTMLVYPNWHPHELLEACDSITLDKLNKFIQSYWQDVQVQALVNGNYTSAEANEIAFIISSHLPSANNLTKKSDRVKVAQLKPASLWHHRIPSSDQNHISTWYCQNPRQGDDMQVQAMLLAKFVEGPFYQSLRTEKQLGYALAAHPFVIKKTSGLVFWVQSPHMQSAQLLNEMQSFVKGFYDGIEKLSETELNQYKNSLIHELRQPPRMLAEETLLWWEAIESEEGDFNRREKLIKLVEQTTLTDLKEYAKLMLDPTKKVGQVVVMSDPQDNFAAESTELQSLTAFRRQTAFKAAENS